MFVLFFMIGLPKYIRRDLQRIIILLIAVCLNVFLITSRTCITFLNQTHHYLTIWFNASLTYPFSSRFYRLVSKINKACIGFQSNRLVFLIQLRFWVSSVNGLAVLVAIFLFFWANKSLFNQAGFILLFLFLLALLNLVYCIYFAKQTLNQYGINTVKEILVKKEIRYKIFRPESRLKYSEMMVFPALIYIDQKVPQAFDARGTWVNWSHNLSTSMQQLPADDYFQINKSCIICREIIKEVLPQKNDCLLIIISFQINKSLMTSRRRTTAFKHWLAESN